MMIYSGPLAQISGAEAEDANTEDGHGYNAF